MAQQQLSKHRQTGVVVAVKLLVNQSLTNLNPVQKQQQTVNQTHPYGEVLTMVHYLKTN